MTDYERAALAQLLEEDNKSLARMIYTFWLPRSSSASKPGNVSAPACGQQPVCLALDLARPFPLRQVFAPVGRGSHGRTKKTLSTEVTGQVFVCIVPD